MINNEIIAKKLEEYALLLELKGEDLFKIRAYKKAAENIRKFEGNLVELLKSDKPAFHIEGIGTHIFQKVSSIIEKGSFKELDELKLEIPESLFELFRIPSLGPKKIYRLYKELGINNIRELEYACQEHRLKGLKGFGDKIQDQIVQGIAFIKKTEGRRLYTEVEPVAKTLEDLFKGVSGVTNVAVAGSYRRRLETIKDLDIVITSEDENISKKIQALSVCEHIKERGEKKISFLIDNLPVDVRFFDTSDFYTALHHLTGSKSHHEKLRAIAKSCGYKLNEYGLYKDNIKIKIDTEKKIYDILGLKYIIPEMREGLFEFDLVIDENEIVNVNDIKGILHIHSNYSDGINTCEDIVQDSIKKGFKFIGISDHSKSAYYAGGLGADDLKRQADEIKKIQEEFPDIMILHGVESDILSDGSLDYADNILESLDFVIASVHSNFNMSKDAMTKRIMCAIDNPYTTIIGHLTSRLILARKPYEIDFDSIIGRASYTKTIIELNANPNRLDIDWRYLPQVVREGVFISINPDAHNIMGLSDYIYGVYMARKGGVTKNFVLNTFEREIFLKAIKIKRK